MSYEKVVTKNSRPYIQSLRDDMKARKNKEFFWPTGTQVYCGWQGSGKTISAVKHLLDLKKRYPKSIIVSNIDLSVMTPHHCGNNASQLKQFIVENDWTESYILFKTMDELAMCLTAVNNGHYGVIYVVDEIHTYFNALDSKNIPMYVFTEISQQRKQRKLIIGTSQLFLRMAKPFREQCDNLIFCSTYFGVLTIQRVFEGATLEQDFDGSLKGNMRRVGWFFHTRKIRNAFDTFQKVVSGEIQFEQTLRLNGKLENKK